MQFDEFVGMDQITDDSGRSLFQRGFRVIPNFRGEVMEGGDVLGWKRSGLSGVVGL